ncbi:MAG: DMT family transporter [Pseudooceanicola sp.]|nr:DMT family transporter [Pseudooceanicola sp.]
MDSFGAAALIGFSALLAFNQVVIKLTTAGVAPVAQAGIRSVGAVIVLLLWARWRGIRFDVPRAALPWGILSGFIFAFEFLCLFVALDLTTVSRASIIFYTMPVWLALAAHFVLPGERLTGVRVLGLALAVLGVVIAMGDRSNGQASLAGDILALVATFGWAAVALMVRATPLSRTPPVTQLMFQVALSAPILLAAAPLFGPLIRDFQPVHALSLLFQSVCVASLGFMAWFWLLTIYRASSVASFAFLAPVLSVIFGWAILGEHIGPLIWVALGLVAAGIFLINRR